MDSKYIESESYFSFEFSGDESIYVDTLCQTINNIAESLQYITSQKEPDAYLKLRITKVRQNSFDIDLNAIIKFIPKLFNKDNLQIANSIISILIGVFEIKKHLKGKKPKEVSYTGSTAIIINVNGERLLKDKETAKLYLENDNIETNIINIFNVLDNDDSRNSLIICKNNKKQVEIKKEEFKNMSKRIVKKSEAVETCKTIVNTELLLKKPDLLGDSQWGFVYNKNIYASIKDEKWLNKVHNGEIKNLYAGVRLPVKLSIEIELDKNKSIIKNSDKYEILEVTGDVIEPHTKQIHLFNQESRNNDL